MTSVPHSGAKSVTPGGSVAGGAELLRRHDKGEITSNEFDVLWEVSHFEADAEYRSARANFAGSKVIYTMADGSERTHWAPDWSMKKDALRAAIAKATAGETRNAEPIHRRDGDAA